MAPTNRLWASGCCISVSKFFHLQKKRLQFKGGVLKVWFMRSDLGVCSLCTGTVRWSVFWEILLSEILHDNFPVTINQFNISKCSSHFSYTSHQHCVCVCVCVCLFGGGGPLIKILFGILDYRKSYGKMIGECQIVKNFVKSTLVLTEIVSQHLLGGPEFD